MYIQRQFKDLIYHGRHISKKILAINYLKFDEKDEKHLRLAELSKIAHEKAALYLKDNPPQQTLTATRLGRLRVDIKKFLANEMREIDRIVKKLIG